MKDTIYIPGDRLQTGILQFVQASALADCTTVETTASSIAITTSWPVAGFSTGELVAWSILRSLVDGDLRRAFDRLDTDSIGALVGCLTAVRDELVA